MIRKQNESDQAYADRQARDRGRLYAAEESQIADDEETIALAEHINYPHDLTDDPFAAPSGDDE